MYPSKATPAIGVLIEGFGRYMGILASPNQDPAKIEEINTAYVIAFEELLITRYPSSTLLQDVIGWMVDEKAKFPSEIQKLIDQRSLQFKK